MESGWLLASGEAVASVQRARAPMPRHRAIGAARRGELAAVLSAPVALRGPLDVIRVKDGAACSVHSTRSRPVVMLRPGTVVVIARGEADRFEIAEGTPIEASLGPMTGELLIVATPIGNLDDLVVASGAPRLVVLLVADGRRDDEELPGHGSQRSSMGVPWLISNLSAPPWAMTTTVPGRSITRGRLLAAGPSTLHRPRAGSRQADPEGDRCAQHGGEFPALRGADRTVPRQRCRTRWAEATASPLASSQPDSIGPPSGTGAVR